MLQSIAILSASFIGLSMISACQPVTPELEKELNAEVMQQSRPHDAQKLASLLRMARATRQAGDMRAASGLYRQALAVAGTEVTPYIELADLYTREMDRADRAIVLLSQASEINPGSVANALAIGRRLIEAEAYHQALTVYEAALQSEAEHIGLLKGKALALDMLGRHRDAEPIYDQAITLAPDQTAVLNNYAMSLIMAGEVARAVSIMEPLVKDPVRSTSRLRQNLALAYGLAGQDDAARRLLVQERLEPEAIAGNMAFYRSYREARRSIEPEAVLPAYEMEN